MAATHKSRPWFLRIFGTKIPTPLDAGRSDLVVVAEGFDDAEASSTALERAGSTEPEFRAESEVVLRHHLDLPEGSVVDAENIVAQDGYVRGVSRPEDVAQAVENSVRVVFERVQVLDALHCSQERSRMAGLAQRLGGSVAGWDALQPPALAEATPKRRRRKS
ncbi:hypothetical protein O4214_13750 [Rhodococcus erythropolis]|uniref:hypothetical protein n=1 Tax=Rhodococcus erythropolis TaxID=1833 RepID=UPI001E4508FE|nr:MULTISPECIES: hypothetical protein [Rhodococcus erythropolis group]MCD2104823.1 hypothetical protein [Rhodococcus qingshengii]MCZ4525049.1 hypothetical protein [Rhodococcus erythropolis]